METFASIKSVIAEIRETYHDVVRTIKEHPVSGYLSLAPAAACALSFLFALIHWIRFAFSRGYQTQMGRIKVLDLGNAFTTGTVSDYYNGVFCIVLGVLLLIGIVAALIVFFREEKTWRRVLTAVAFTFGIVCFGLGLADVMVRFARGVGFIPEQFHESIRNFAREMDFDALLVFASLALMIGVAALLWSSDVRELFINVFIAALVSFAGVPLILLLPENLVVLILLVVLLFAIPIIMLFGKIIDLLGIFAGDASAASGSGGSGSYGGSGRSGGSGGSRPKAQKTSQKASPMAITKNSGSVQKEGKVAYVKLSSNYKLVIHDGKVCGRNVQAGSEYFIWNEPGFKSGEWKIVDANTGREITWGEVEKR